MKIMAQGNGTNLLNPLQLRDLCNGGTCFEFNTEQYIKSRDFLSETMNELSMHDEVEDVIIGNPSKGAPGDESFETIAARMTNVTDDGLVKKSLLRAGYGESVTEEVEAHVHYNAFWEGENSPYDSTYMRGYPQVIRPHECEILPGIATAIMSMTLGEEAMFLISYKMLFGEKGCPPRIKPKADALFMIEVVKVRPYVIETDNNQEITLSTVFKNSKALRVLGVNEFKQKKYYSAIKKFEKAVDILEKAQVSSEEETEEKLNCLIKLYTNLAVAFNQVGKHCRTCSICIELSKITDISKLPKLLFHYGRALFQIGEYETAKIKLLQALNLKPDDTDIGKELSKIEKQLQSVKQNEKEMCIKALGFEVDKPETKYNVSDRFIEEIKLYLQEFLENEAETNIKLSGAYIRDEVEYFKKAAKDFNINFEENKVTREYIFSKK